MPQVCLDYPPCTTFRRAKMQRHCIPIASLKSWISWGKTTTTRRDKPVAPSSLEPATAELTAWVRDGVVSLPETVLEGIERYPEALQFMFEGGNVGKLLVKAS